MSASRGNEPPLHVCEICGQKFGATSIDIHVPQCFNKQLSAWLLSDRTTRGPKPTPPAPRRQGPARPAPTRRGGGSIGNAALAGPSDSNRMAIGSHGRSPRGVPATSTSVPCPHCGRRVTAGDLSAHMESCNRVGRPGSATRPACTSPVRGDRGRGTCPYGGASPTRDGGSGRSGDGSGAIGQPRHGVGGVSVEEAAGGALQHRRQGERPVLPRCYLCGQQFGTTSIAIHVPQCYTKKLAQWSAADPHTRGRPPKHPDTVDWQGGPGVSVQAQSDAQFREFTSNLEACPHCGRKFAADRLQVHLRSCRPGNTSRPVSARSPSSPMVATTAVSDQLAARDAPTAQHSPPSASAVAVPPSSSSVNNTNAMPHTERAAITKVTGNETRELSTERVSPAPRLDPTQNRLPSSHRCGNVKASKRVVERPVPPTRTCEACHVAEYEADAKFCRNCGTQLPTLEKCQDSPTTAPTVVHDPQRVASTTVNDGKVDDNAGLACPSCGAGCVAAEDSFCDRCGSRLRPRSANTAAIAATLHSHSEESNVGVKRQATAAATSKEECQEAADNDSAAPAATGAATMRFYCSYCREFVDDPDAIYCEDCGRKLSRCAPGAGEESTARHTLPPSHSAFRASPATTARRETTVTSAEQTARTSPKQSSRGAEAADASTRDGPSSRGIEEGSERAAAEAGDEVLTLPDDEEQRKPCPRCGRLFRQSALERHVSVCLRLKSRPTFNMTRQRLADVEVPCTPGRTNVVASSEKKAPPKKDWRSESEAFRRAMREARVVSNILSAGGNVRDLPPPTYSTHDDYVQCPHCSRRFAADVAERHIPRCANTVNRPKPPPKRR